MSSANIVARAEIKNWLTFEFNNRRLIGDHPLGFKCVLGSEIRLEYVWFKLPNTWQLFYDFCRKGREWDNLKGIWDQQICCYF